MPGDQPQPASGIEGEGAGRDETIQSGEGLIRQRHA